MDKVGDFLTRIRNASSAKQEKVDIPASNLRVGIAKILAEKGFIRSFKVVKDTRQGMMRVYLKYDEAGASAISNLKIGSKPGRRIYIKSQEIPVIRNGLGISILSTSKGIISNKEAVTGNVGGELLCTVW